MAKPFRWTRAKYRRAHRETRIYDREGYLYHGEPPLVGRFRELWEQHPQNNDPLLTPIRWRLPPDDGIPF